MAWHPLRNPGLKTAALVLGTALWITVSGQQVEREVLVQLQFRNVPASLEIVGNAPRTVDVRLSGASEVISRLQNTEVVATLDLVDARAGVRVFPLIASHIQVPLGVQVKSVDPATVSLTLEPSGTAEAAVKPTIDGEPARGFEVGTITWEPKSVAVVGPQSRLKERPSAVTERISIEGATSAVVETVSLGVSDPAVRLRDPQGVLVTIAIVPSPLTRFANRPVQFRHVPTGRDAGAEPAAVTVTLRGNHSALAGVTERDIEPYVDLTGVAPGRYTLQVRVDPHGDYEIATVEPATVTVRIR